jgi:hypothetical protein
MMRIRALLETPIVCLLLVGALMIAAHTIDWPIVAGSRAQVRRPEFSSGQLTGPDIIEIYCSGCHHAGRSGVDFDVEMLTLDAMRSDRETWAQVVDKLRSHAMPPRKFPQPSKLERDFLIAWLEQEVLDERGFANDGPIMVRRLQRSEYLNSVRDLLNIQPSVEIVLPKDETAWRRCDRIPEAAEHGQQYRVAAELLLAQTMAALVEANAAAAEEAVEDHRLFSSRCACLTSAESARGILGGFVRRAYRKPAETGEIYRLVGIFEQAESRGASFQESMKSALLDVLTSPHFLYRTERRTPELAPLGEEYALAARLSYFLWRSTPDGELLAQAEQGTLSKNLDAHVRRLLKDERARAFATEFAEYWLGLALLNEVLNLDEKLSQAMRQETEHFAAHILREDRSVLEFLHADYTFLNERLAAHYGIPGVYGNNMRRVDIAGTERGGLLGQASILTVTSPNVETSPVNRGKWVMERLLGAPPIKPPPGLLEALPARSTKNGSVSLRQNLAMHRDNPSCAQCHLQLDSIGLALETFDARGQWRRENNGPSMDFSTALADGELLHNPNELKAYLLTRRASFVRGLHEKLLQFALGRKIDDRDRAALELVLQKDAQEPYPFSQVILNVVQSVPFQEGWLEKARNRP